VTARPSAFLVKGQKVLDLIKNEAPPHVQEGIQDLLLELQTNPYPAPGRFNVSPMKGTDLKHTYVAWCDVAEINYRVAQDQPAILLIGAHWRSPSGGPDGGEDFEVFGFRMAA
jgi:hypothetical protein